MRVFHRTEGATAVAIIREGFRDSAQKYVSDFAWRGVWVSDRPPGPGEGSGDALLTLEIPAHVFAVYEWTQEPGASRGSLIPASILNKYGPPLSVDAGR